MSDMEHLEEELRLAESLYAAAKMRVDHQAAKAAAEDMARLHKLVLLAQQQESDEQK